MSLEKILVVHGFYQLAGGEDEAFRRECDLLESRGHSVLRFTTHNRDIEGQSLFKTASNTLWNPDTHQKLLELVRREKPAVVHFHNTFPLISPSGYAAAKQGGSRVVQTLHNYRLVCPNALFYRDHHPCEDCLGKSYAWPGVMHRCYRGSRAGSAVVASWIAFQRARGTWRKDIDAFIALTEFARQKFVQGGLPEAKLRLKPNFAVDPGTPTDSKREDFALFVGRLSEEKGVETLLEAWRELAGAIPLRIVGDGPVGESGRAQGIPGITWLGAKSREEVTRLMSQASVLVLPSKVYEGFPMVVAEAYASGLPVVASGHGGLSSLIRPGVTGELFQPENAIALAETARKLWTDPAKLNQMSREARLEYERYYTPEANYRQLMSIYREKESSS